MTAVAAPETLIRADRIRAAVARAVLGEDDPRRVAICETHISVVFVAGERAFKLKKPLVLPFLDYGTPQRRREMCREEVRLNRRLAPDLYLGVRGLAPRADGGLELVAEDDPAAVEFLVEMRRYDEDATLAATLARGELRRAQIGELAQLLARFHAEAPPVTTTVVPALEVHRRMTENFHELLAIVERRAEIERVLALERFVHAYVVTHAGMLDARSRRGRVREGHGDLRADHVLLAGDAVRVVDCVEFDHGLRALDVADDLAFLVMDLVARGGERFARRLVRDYRDAGGDPGDDALIAFYAAYRALVRAKIALLRAAQEPAGGAAHGRDSAAARDLLTLAERFSWSARLPLAIVVCGLPASGKSRLAHELAELSGIAQLSSDVTRKRLAGLAPTARGDGATYADDASRRTYAELGRRARRQAAAHGGVILDATFRRRADRDAFRASFGAAAPLLFIECDAPPAVLLERARRRERDVHRVSDATPDVVERLLASWEPLTEVPARAHVVLRSDRSVEEMIADLRGLLDERVGRLATS